MNNNRQLFWAGTYAATLYWLLSEMFTPILSLYVSDLGFSVFQISVIFAAQTFVPFLFTIQIGYIADRIGQHNMLAVGAGFMILGSTLLLLSDHYFAFIATQTLVGIGHIAVWLSSQSIVTFVGDGSREKAIARMSFFTAIGQLAGPLFGGFIHDQFNFKWVFITYTILSFALLAVYAMLPRKRENQSEVNERQSVPVPKPRFSMIGTYNAGLKLYASNRGIQAGTMISFSLAFILFIRVSYLPIYLKEQSYNTTEIGLWIALWSLASILIRPFTARFIESFGRYPTTGAALFMSVIGLMGFSLFPGQIGLIVSLVLVGLGTGLNQPLAISLISSATDKRNRGLGMGLRLMSNRLANWVCPLAIGATSYFVGLGASFVVVSLPLAAVSMFSMKVLGHLAVSKVTTPKKGVESV